MKFYLLSPEGVPMNQVLFPNLIPTFLVNGHEFVPNISDADIVLMDLHSRQHDYKQEDVDWICNNNVPLVSWDEFDKGGMSTLDWPDPLTEQQKRIFDHIENKDIAAVHFCRLLNKNNKYPSNVFPYEKPILYEEPMCSADELFNRPYDICMICNESPARWSIAKAIQSDAGFNSIIQIAHPKIPFDNWINAHRQAKFFVSASGGGFSSERPQNLFSISCHIAEKTDQLLLHDFVDGETCLKISTHPTKEELDKIYEYCNNKDLLYQLYKSNYDFMKTYYSAEAIALDILSKILKHFA